MTGNYEVNFFGSSDSINSTDTINVITNITDSIYARDKNNPESYWRVGRTCGDIVLGVKYEIFQQSLN